MHRVFPARLTAVAAAVLPLAAACGGSPASSPKPLAQWLTFNAAARTVTVTAEAGYHGINAGRNFNGYFRGSVLVTAPRGWRVTVHCINLDSAPHSCAIVSGSLATRPAFTGAVTRKPTVGVAPGRSAAFSFHATGLGSYRLASLVGDDELMGMWDVLEIARSGRPHVALLRRYNP